MVEINPVEWINKYEGKIFDIDGVYGIQCVDLFKILLRDIGFPNPAGPIGGDGYADNIWYLKEKYGTYFDFVQGDCEVGDIVLWRKGAKECPSSHVAMFVKDDPNDNSRGIFFGSNQGYAHSPGVFTSLSMSGSLGALRYKGFTTRKAQTEELALIPEHRFATVLEGHCINIRGGSPDGRVLRQAKAGDTIEYTEKCVTNGHRYISWIEKGMRMFMAVTPTEERANHWVSISAIGKKDLSVIDISEHQGTIDFAKVKDAVDGVILRASYGTIEDKKFKEYVQGCKANQIPILGLYVFDYALDESQARDEADYLCELAIRERLPKETYLFFDCEGDSVRYARDNGIDYDRAQVQHNTRLFLDRIKRHGFKTGYYSNLDWQRNRYAGFKKMDDELFWYARYGHPEDLECDIWQYGSDGKVPGIAGLVDMNTWHRNDKTPVINQPDNSKEPEPERWEQNAIVRIGDTVKSVSCRITKVQGDRVYVPALGGFVPLSDVSEAEDTGDGAKDDYLANTDARVFLDPCTVEDIDIGRNMAKVHGYWVKSDPLMVKQ